MRAPPLLSRSSNKAAALIIVLAFVVLVTGLALAYFSSTTIDRALAHSSYNDTSADLLARSALDVVIGDFKQEIANGSTATTVSGTTIYIPANATNMVPQQSGNVAGVPNLIRRSVRSDPLSGNPGVPSRASAVSSQDDPSTNSRSISSTRWNGHYLVPKGNTATPDSSPIQAFTLATPDWVFVKAYDAVTQQGGPAVITSPDASVIGRYAYAVYDEGGLLNMNIVGYPIPGTPWPALDPEIARNKNVPGAFNLTALGTPVGPTAPNPFNQVIGFRNYATGQATGPGTISGTLGSFSWDQNAIGNFIAYVLGSPVGQPKLGFGPSGRDFGAVNPVSTPSGSSFRTDQSFITRAELINLFKSLNFDCTTNTGICLNTLQYLGTFSLEQNKPTLPLTPQWPTTSNWPRVVLPQRFYLGNLNCVQHPAPASCSGGDADIRTAFGSEWVNTNGSGPCDSQIRWKYVGPDTNNHDPLSYIPRFGDLTKLDCFQYINYALFGRSDSGWPLTGDDSDLTHIPYTFGIGAAFIDQYDADALNTGIYYGGSGVPCSGDPGLPASACLVYGPEQTGSTVTYQPPLCITPPTGPDPLPTSPNSINQPTRSVGEFGWAYSILNAANNHNVPATGPKYRIDFKDPYDPVNPDPTLRNPDPALLDFFTYNSAPIRAGIVSLNTRQPLVLAAILKTAYCGFQILTANQASAAANAIVTTTTAQPAMSRADIARIANTMPLSPCNTTDQDSEDTFARGLSEVTQTRTWGLLIDVVAQTGHYKPNATNLQTDFIVEGEKHYWLHIAIDRFDGSIVGQQLEEVTE
ncbi:MAG: hypothetical protein ACREFF_14000 [Candidatus Udaeobacter sp.]